MAREEYRAYDDLDIRFQMGNLMINVLYIRLQPTGPTWEVGYHCHNSYELHIIPSGKGIVRVNQKTFHITPGVFYLTGPGVYHLQKSDKDDPMVEYCINFEFKVLNRSSADKDYAPLDEINEIMNTLFSMSFWFGRDEYNSTGLFENIIDELDHQWLGYFIKIQNIISQIIINTVRCYVQQKKASYAPPLKVPEDKRSVVLENFFTGEYHKDVTPEELARRIGVSRRQLNRIVKQHFSMTFKEKLTHSRLENAKDLLLNSSLSIEAIADRVGFSCSSYFCKVFKERIGVTPTEYRNK